MTINGKVKIGMGRTEQDLLDKTAVNELNTISPFLELTLFSSHSAKSLQILIRGIFRVLDRISSVSALFLTTNFSKVLFCLRI
jgi:hypothetical protein